jgi:arylsulfatase A-like enzyme
VTGRNHVAGAIALALTVVSCARDEPVRDAPSARLRPTRGYVLISLDTLRADHLSLYGYSRPTSPFLESLAARAIVFDLAIAQIPNTLASHMSIFTGLYPAEHGVHPPRGVLAPQIETLPEAFARAGFRTAGFTEGGYMRGRPGFRRGFDQWNASAHRGPREIERTFERGLDFLRRLDGDDRFFLFLHTYAPHAPYAPPAPYGDLYWEGPPPAGPRPSDRELAELNLRGERLPEDVVAWYVALYDGTLRYVDDVLASFFGELGALGLDGDTTVVITSDHGEEFQEHGRLAHTQLYHETLHVPLLLAHPDVGAREAGSSPGTGGGAAARRWPGLVESVDIAPTLLALAGIAPRAPQSGRDLLGAIARSSSERSAWAETLPYQRALYRQQGSTLLHIVEHLSAPPRASGGAAVEEQRRPSSETGTRSSGGAQPNADDALPRVELYDVGADPGERRQLGGERAREARSILRELRERRFVARSAPLSGVLDAEEEQELRALGYL